MANVNVKVNKKDLFKLLEYSDFWKEERDWEECGKPRSGHIYLTLRKIMKQVGYEA